MECDKLINVMSRDLWTATHLQEVVVLGVKRKGDLLGGREHVREVLVGKLVKLLCMVCIAQNGAFVTTGARCA